ncbi:MAG: hypothetical protein OXF41_14375 [bacterium]|nr:hypothetical protein [bacterium]
MFSTLLAAALLGVAESSVSPNRTAFRLGMWTISVVIAAGAAVLDVIFAVLRCCRGRRSSWTS